MLFVIVSAAAAFMMFFVIVSAAAVFMFGSGGAMSGNSAFALCNDNIRFQTVRDFLDFRKKCIGILSGQSQLPGGKGDGDLLYTGQRGYFAFNLRSTVAQPRFSII